MREAIGDEGIADRRRDGPGALPGDGPRCRDIRTLEGIGAAAAVEGAREFAELQGERIVLGAADKAADVDELGTRRVRLTGRGDRAGVRMEDGPGGVGIRADEGVGAAAAVDRPGEIPGPDEGERVLFLVGGPLATLPRPNTGVSECRDPRAGAVMAIAAPERASANVAANWIRFGLFGSFWIT